jgi:hypothetical protein
MSTYQIVDGFDHAGTLADVTIQPRSAPAQYARMQVGGDGLVYADGYLRTSWIYNSLTETDFAALLTEFGFNSDSVTANEVTVKTKGSSRSFATYNAIIYRSKPSFDFYMKRVEFELVLVEAL